MGGPRLDGWKFSECVTMGPTPMATQRLQVAAERLFQPAVWLQAGEMFRLSNRHIEVMLLIARGVPSLRIAEGLGISPQTLKKHRDDAYAKLGVTCMAQAVVKMILATGLLLKEE